MGNTLAQWVLKPAAAMNIRISQATTARLATLTAQISSSQPMRCHKGFFSHSCTSGS